MRLNRSRDKYIHAGLALHSRLNAPVSGQWTLDSRHEELNSAFLPSWNRSRSWVLQIAEKSSGIHATQGNPVVPSPAKHAANGAQRKHGQQAIERAQLRLFELH
jgi:hypothetical protein